MDEVVVKPSTGRLILLALMCLVFTVAGVAMLFADDWFTKILGAVAILFFGGGGAWAFVRQSKQGMTYTLTPRGIVVGSGGLVSWDNIAQIGETKVGAAAPGLGGAAALGVALRDPNAYVATLTPDQRATAMRAARMGKVAGPALGAIGGRGVGSDLSSIPTHDVVAAVGWAAERSGGYHVTFPLLNLDKSVDKALAEIEAYRSRIRR